MHCIYLIEIAHVYEQVSIVSFETNDNRVYNDLNIPTLVRLIKYYFNFHLYTRTGLMNLSQSCSIFYGTNPNR